MYTVLKRWVAIVVAMLAIAAPLLVVAQPASATPGPGDDRLTSTPTGWWTYGGVSPSSLNTLLTNNNARLTDLQVNTTSPLTFSATMVRNTGSYASGWWWYYGITPAQLNSYLSANNGRLISLAPYTTDGSNTLFAAVMVPNTGANAKAWWYAFNVSPAQISSALTANNARLTRLQSAVIGGARRYTALMVSNTGTDNYNWHYYYGQTLAQVNSLTATNSSRLIDVDRRDDGLFDVVMYLNSPSKTWFWYSNYSISSLVAKASALGTRIIDINSYVVGGTRYYAGIFLDNAGPLTQSVRKPFLDAGLRQGLGTGDGYFGFELKPVGSAASTALRSTTAYEPASALKVLYHLYAMRAIAAGTAFDTTQVTYMMTYNGSCPVSNPATTTLKNAMTLMMQNSDNAMTKAVADYFGRANIQAYANSIGLTSTQINHDIGCGTPANRTSLADLTKIYEGVQNGTLLDPNYKATFYARMLNQNNYSPFRTYICNLSQQEAVKLGKSSSTASAFCNAITWAAKGGDYSVNGYEYHGGLADYGMPIMSGGVISSFKHYIWGEYDDHVTYASAANGTAINNARSAAGTAAIIGVLDQALATW